MKQNKKIPSVNITIPVLNEEDTLESKILILQSYISDQLASKASVSIVIADNGSSDNTNKLGRKLALENDNIKFVETNKKGVGLALKESWLRYESNIMGYMDLDLATDLSHIKEAIDMILFDNHKIVAGSRLMKESEVIGRKPIRSFLSITFNKILKILFKVNFTDGMCGFKFFDQGVMKRLEGPESILSSGWFFATEFLILSERANIKVKDIPIKWTDDSSSKVKIIRLSLQYLYEMLLLKKRLFLEK